MPNYINKAAWQDAILKEEILAEIGGGEVPVEIVSEDITDATEIGIELLTAEDAEAARTAIGAGTSNLELGTTASTALAGNGKAASATTADALSTARTITLTGDVTGTVNFDGSANASITTAVASGVIVNADINASAAIALTKLANVAAGTDGLAAGTLQATLQALATRIQALEDAAA